ncbi:hypothetical protein ABEF95_001186 [Exophiala dermatitidis]
MTTGWSWPRWLSVTISVLYYALFPIYLVLRVLWYILVLLSTPFVSLGHVLARISLIPWRIFARFEAVWYFLGCAVVIGTLLGLLLHFTMVTFVMLFDLDRKPSQKPARPKGHDAISYRKAREAKKQKQKQLEEQQKRAVQARLIASQPLLQEVMRDGRKLSHAGPSSSPLSPSVAASSRAGLLRETILEHSEEDEDDLLY